MEELLKLLFENDELHKEYKDNNIHYVIDSVKEDEDTLHITIKVDNPKKEFEDWVNDLPDDIFQEAYENLSESEGLHKLDEIYSSENYQEVIDKFKSEVKKIANMQIEKLKTLL